MVYSLPQGETLATSRGLVGSLWLLWVAFVVYGSLVPLEFRAMPWEQALAQFSRIPMLQLGISNRADWVANLVLYVPVGFFTALLLAGSSTRPGLLSLLVAVFFGLVLAVVVEFAQLYFPARTVSQNDLLAESLGTALGVILARLGAGWLPTLQTVLKGNWRRAAGALVPAGALAILAFSLFPFDLLISSSEFATKAASPMWGWWVAPVFSQGAESRQIARWVAELLVVVPLGVLWARSATIALLPLDARASLVHALVLGAALGLAVELGQWFFASGVSQGLSVVSRALGWALGAWLWNRRRKWGAHEWRSAVSRLSLPLALLQAMAVVVLSGWFGSAWRTPAEAVKRALGGELHFVPFYYHYYTSEALALQSVLSVALAYALVGLWGWARNWTLFQAALVASMAATIVEVGKLFPLATRPDPTNVLIAGASAAVALLMLQLFTAEQGAASDDVCAAGGPSALVRKTHTAPNWRYILLVAVAGLASFWVVAFPVYNAWVALGIFACAVLVWWRPVTLLAMVAATLPVLSLSAWSGREYVDEFDVLVLVCLAVAYARRPQVLVAPARDGLLSAALWLVAGSVMVSTLLGWAPWELAALRHPDSPLSPWYSLRLFKGWLYAVGLYAVARKQHAAGLPVLKSFGAGLVVGLALVVCFVVWERAAFVGVWNFSAPYRAAGPMVPMRLGGAYLDTFLVVSLPFALVGAVYARSFWWRVLCGVTALGAAYAVAVTYTRTTYLAAAFVGLVVVFAALRPWPRQKRGLALLAAAMLMALLAVTYPIITGPFATARLALVKQDWNTRLAHTEHVIQLGRDHGGSMVFGQGLGRFPADNYWAHQGASPPNQKVAVHRFLVDVSESQLQLGSGAGLYLDQAIRLGTGQHVDLELLARASGPNGVLSVSICSKWLLSSDNCVQQTLSVTEESGGWQRLSAQMQTSGLGKREMWRSPFIRMSLSNAGDARIDIEQISLRDAKGSELLLNTDFSAGSDHWNYTSDDHLAWHAKNMVLAIWFDMGWAGVIAFGGLLVLALVRSGRGAWAGDRLAQALFAALVGLLVVSVFDSVMDEPRFLLLLLVLAWLGALGPLDQKVAPQPVT